MTSSMMGSSGMRGPTGMNTGNTSTGMKFSEKVPSGYKAGALQQFTPEQMQLFQQLFSNVGPESYLSKLAQGDESLFSQMEAPALKQFSQLQGGLASRFSGMGGTGARRSSGFQNTANEYASSFAQDLASKRQELQRQAIMDLMGLSENLLQQRPYERFLVKKPQSSMAETFGRLGGAIPGLISSFTGGGSAGDALKGAFSIFGGG